VKTAERYINLPEDHHMEAFAALESFNTRATEQTQKQTQPRRAKASQRAGKAKTPYNGPPQMQKQPDFWIRLFHSNVLLFC